MALPRSKLTTQGQISVPAEVRRKLGLGPGAVLEWDEEDGRIVVRRAGRFTSADIHRALFTGAPPEPTSVEDLKQGIRRHIKKRYARG
jgi:AbrB family looped-hinge helix DNA binding protein